LTDKERKEISEFIRSGKKENNRLVKPANAKKKKQDKGLNKLPKFHLPPNPGVNLAYKKSVSLSVSVKKKEQKCS
jgi:hypothetical protein